MADKSAIEWTEATWNPTTGCDRVSSGCDNCYAMTLAKRLKAMGSIKYQTDGDPRTSGPGFGVALHPDALDIPRRWRDPRTVFVNSMSDLFHARVPLTYVQQVFAVMRETPRHTFQVLTKRASRLAKVAHQIDWPANVWMGVSVEDRTQRERVDQLREVPAAVRFISAEPLLGPLVDLDLDGIDWLIAGASRAGLPPDGSGVGARPPGSVRGCGHRVLLQTVGRAYAEGWRPAPRRSDLGRDAGPAPTRAGIRAAASAAPAQGRQRTSFQKSPVPGLLIRPCRCSDLTACRTCGAQACPSTSP